MKICLLADSVPFDEKSRVLGIRRLSRGEGRWCEEDPIICRLFQTSHESRCGESSIMNDLIIYLRLFCCISLVILSLCENRKQTNVLFIMYDDLRPELSIYGKKHMKTPNFERLASKSVVFDNAYCQISVCNPSRGSLLTGLRPDTVKMYAFGSDFRPHISLPTRFLQSGYKTAGVGKVFHWEDDDSIIWNSGHWEYLDWYDYQSAENGFMNASTQPDKTRRLEEFRDYAMTTKSIEMLQKFASQDDYFFMGIGFKLPHLALHVPYSYWDYYRKMEGVWDVDEKELRYPKSTPSSSYRCCSDEVFRFLEDDGAAKSTKEILLGGTKRPNIPVRMHQELMWAYSGAISFLDDQLGRILDTLDSLDLWRNVTVVLTSDHGMHNGEKGLWEKWTTFDESTRVPLIIHHPDSNTKGQHFTPPVELIDVFPTVIDLAKVPPMKKTPSVCDGRNQKCKSLQGQSLAPALFLDRNSSHSHGTSGVDVKLSKSYALSQMFLCANKAIIEAEAKGLKMRYSRDQWSDCPEDKMHTVNKSITIVAMQYSMRTAHFRYTALYHFNAESHRPDVFTPVIYDELYDHRNEGLESFGHSELRNVAKSPNYQGIRRHMKESLDYALRPIEQGPHSTRNPTKKPPMLMRHSLSDTILHIPT